MSKYSKIGGGTLFAVGIILCALSAIFLSNSGTRQAVQEALFLLLTGVFMSASGVYSFFGMPYNLIVRIFWCVLYLTVGLSVSLLIWWALAWTGSFLIFIIGIFCLLLIYGLLIGSTSVDVYRHVSDNN